ncbi:hypothetical protein [Billgrantia bachuensis]|uniref:Uncharacterized protein n=1 Tax=Billgrantia bachuensis TaxID=2717286 RepID=A0ABX0PRQ4_9GAMM|nr:hypothetical protein [Halomonas bachuensis]NIC05215.1 hypothetical protein [Halomonas bachuensis]
MTKPTHTHRSQGGRYVEVSQHAGTGPLEGQQLVIYHDIGRDVQSATTADDWRLHWRPIAQDDCPVCMGAGTDQIKGNKAKPCGGCYGLGKVRKDGETPADMWELAGIAERIIIELENDVKDMTEHLALPGVLDLIKRQRQKMIDDSIAESEHKWRAGPGKGHGGQRHTGD